MNKLTAAERHQVLSMLNCGRFADQAPLEVYAQLLDEGAYLRSVSTMYRILGRTGDPTRFVDEAAFASYNGTAPIEVASADKQRHRLSRSGDRTLNSAIHIVDVTQARTPSGDGYAYHQRKMSEGKTSREAMRCLKRQVAKRLWRTMRDDLHQRMSRHRRSVTRPRELETRLNLILMKINLAR